ncbi:MAG: hypothetical protein PSV16_00690 [Flavobacterium sp.]|nr:hypothetical protein [Flavobacterium sp.]
MSLELNHNDIEKIITRVKRIVTAGSSALDANKTIDENGIEKFTITMTGQDIVIMSSDVNGVFKITEIHPYNGKQEITDAVLKGLVEECAGKKWTA